MAKQFAEGAPAKLHAPGRPWHKVRVRLWKQNPDGTWIVNVRRWGPRALRANPAVGALHLVTANPEQLRLLPGPNVFEGLK